MLKKSHYNTIHRMIKFLLHILIWFGVLPVLSGQGGECLTEQIMKEIHLSHPGLLDREHTLENKYVQHHNSARAKSGNLTTQTLPIVVHIIHNNGSENISDDQVIRAIQYLNEAFSNDGPYQVMGGHDTGIRFCLASRNPYGLPTSGIERYITPDTDMRLHLSHQRIVDIATWDTKNYINIRLVKKICTSIDCGSTTGYAYLPSAHGLDVDGIVIQADVFGSSAAATSVAAHEMGHYLGLYHTFRGGCKNNNCLTDGDKVCDTPPDGTNLPASCNATINSCLTDEDDINMRNPFRSMSVGGMGDQPDDMGNFLDYNSHGCRKQFSRGQISRMTFFLEGVRSSLLTSKVCLEPCDAVLISDFATDKLIYDVGEQIVLLNQSMFAQYYEWYVNGDFYSGVMSPDFSALREGQYTIMLVVSSDDIKCDRDSSYQQLTIVCPVVAAFTHSIADSVLIFESSAQQAATIQFTLYQHENLIYTTGKSIDTLHLTNGRYTLCLMADNGQCRDSICQTIEILPDDAEICTNGKDDDGDGLIDSFDPDCPCDNSNTLTLCPSDCKYIPDSTQKIKMKLKWMSQTLSDGHSQNGNVLGDYNGDGIVEIIVKGSRGVFMNALNKVFILNGENGIVKDSFNIIENYTVSDFPTNLSIAKNNTEEVKIYLNFGINIHAYSPFGEEKFVAPNTNSIYTNIADFNGDGQYEVYAGHEIINGQTGNFLMKNFANGCAGNNSCGKLHSIAADVLPEPGLELITGQYIYSIEINNSDGTAGNIVSAKEMDAPVKDGKCSVGDFNGDGLLEVVVVRGGENGDGGIWLVDPSTGGILAKNIANDYGGVPVVGDVDGDCVPEICIVFENELRVYKYNGSSILNPVHRIGTAEKSSRTSPILFDFNQDGINEIVYRDQESLRIFNGITGTTIDSFAIESGTAYEFPIVADIDNDGQAEIIVNGYIPGTKQVRIFCFESAAAPWAPARKVWNQTGYHVTNVNDDLTIPRHQQNMAAFFDTESCAQFTCPQPYNSFMAQPTYHTQEGCMAWPAADVSLDVWRYECSADSLIFFLVIGNESDKNIAEDSMALSIYATIPDMTASPLDRRTIYLSRDAEGKVSRRDTLRLAMAMPDTDIRSLLFRINDTGLGNAYASIHGLSSTLECDYDNNNAHIAVDISARSLNLGPDIQKCRTEVVSLDAGSGFVSYLWSDLSRDSIFSTSDAGVYSLTATDQCGRTYQDMVTFTINESLQPDLGPDILLCEGDTTSVSAGSDFTWVQWFPREMVSCDTCFSTLVTADTAFELVMISNRLGCIDADTIKIDVKALPRSEKQTSICAGTSMDFYGQAINKAGRYEHRLGQCDSLIILDVTLLKSDSTILAQDICVGDSIRILDTWYKNSIETTLSGKNIYGCDSIVHVSLRVIDTLKSVQSLTFCEGDSIFVKDRWIDTAGKYDYAFTSATGCDSIATYNVAVIPAGRSVSSLTVCEGDSIFVQNQWLTSAGKYDFTFTSAGGCDSIATYNLAVIPASRSVRTFSFCRGDSIYVADRWYYDAGNYEAVTTGIMGCDSIISIVISTFPASSDMRSLSVCVGDSILVHNTWQHQAGTYTETFSNSYGCDSISVVTLSVSPYLTENETRTICDGDSIWLHGQMIYTAGIYIDTLPINGSCQKIRTTQVSVIDRAEETMKLTLCPDSTVTIANVVIDKSGTFTIDLTSQAGCDSTLTILADKLSWPDPPAIDINCREEKYTATWTPQAPWNITWSDGSTANMVEVYQAGTLSMRSFAAGCEKIYKYELPPIPNQSDIPQLSDLLATSSASLPLSVDLDETSWTIVWMPEALFSCADCFGTEVTTKTDTTITVVMTHKSGCSFEQQFRIIRKASSEISIPNIFNPASTGGNNIWTLTVPTGAQVAEINIYDRWGNKVFTSKNENLISWDGSYHGNPLSSGVYVYHLKVVDANGKVSVLYGDVTLIR